MATVRTVAELLYLFRDGQPKSSIGPEPFQDAILSLHAQSGSFQDLPSSPAGLAAGRLWLNGDIIQVSTGAPVPVTLPGNFQGAVTAALFANAALVRRAGRSKLDGTVSLRADPQRSAAPLREFSSEFAPEFD